MEGEKSADVTPKKEPLADVPKMIINLDDTSDEEEVKHEPYTDQQNDEDTKDSNDSGDLSDADSIVTAIVETAKSSSSSQESPEDDAEKDPLGSEGEKDGECGETDLKTDIKPLIRIKGAKFLKQEPNVKSEMKMEEKPKTEPTLTVKTTKQLTGEDTAEEDPSTAGLSVVNSDQPGSSSMDFTPVDNMENGVLCDVCNDRFLDPVILEQHKSTLGHYKCQVSASCSALLFPSSQELLKHQEEVHGISFRIPPINQLSPQLQGIPFVQQQPRPAYNLGSAPMQGGMPVGGPPAPMQAGMPVGGPQTFSGFQPNQSFSTVRQNGPPPPTRPLMPLQQTHRRGDMPPVQYPGAKRQFVQGRPRNTTPTKRSRFEMPQRRQPSVSTDPTGDVVNKLSKTVSLIASRSTPPKKPSETTQVANILANRGVTVTATPKSVARFLNSSVTIIPTSGKQNGSSAADLTDTDSALARRGHSSLPGRDSNGRNQQYTCNICDKVFTSGESLNHHAVTIHGKKQLPYKCSQCTAYFATSQSLIQHKSTHQKNYYSGNATATNDMMIPVVDLSNSGTVARLSSLGIGQFIPLSALGSQQSGGTFAIPIIPAGSSQGANNLSSLGASCILPLGPLQSFKNL